MSTKNFMFPRRSSALGKWLLRTRSVWPASSMELGNSTKKNLHALTILLLPAIYLIVPFLDLYRPVRSVSRLFGLRQPSLMASEEVNAFYKSRSALSEKATIGQTPLLLMGALRGPVPLVL